MIRRRKIDTDIERKLLIALITSKAFCQEVVPKLKTLGMEVFQISYARKVAQWAIDYYEEIGDAPEKHIQDIYTTEKKKLSEEETELIADFLDALSSEYETESNFNVAFLRRESLRYLKTRTYEIFFERGLAFIEQGKLTHAERLYLEFTKVPEETSEVFDPFSDMEIKNHDLDGEVNRLIQLPGALGELVGPLERSWLASIAGPEKRGKSYFLEEFIFQALFDKLKVLWFSLEMNKYVMKNRIYSRITAALKNPGKLIIPVLDCKNNQQGICHKKKRVNDITLINEFGAIPDFDPKSSYKPCTVCRNMSKRKGVPSNRSFVPDYWFEEIEIPQSSTEVIQRRASQFKQMFGSNLRCRAFPAFSANFDDISHEIELLRATEGFIPDIVAIDYFDILAEESGVRSDRGSVDKTWKRGKNLAAEMDCLVITPDQTNKASRGRETIQSMDTTEDKRKDAHVDVKIAINQTMQENDDGVARIGVLFHRHRKVMSKQAMVFQCLELANPFMDSVLLHAAGALKREKEN